MWVKIQASNEQHTYVGIPMYASPENEKTDLKRDDIFNVILE